MNSIKFSLDKRSEIPATAQVMEQVRQKLIDGELRPGDQLPTVRQLASELRVNFNTIARAYRMLDDAGLISTQRGRGTYILTADEQSQTRVHKSAALETQVEQFLALLNKQGYTTNEIAACLGNLLQNWQHETMEEFDKESEKEKK